MGNLTITTDEEVLKKARLRALEEGTSVNAVLSEYLKVYAGMVSDREAALADLLSIARSAQSGRGGSQWPRDELHER